MDYLNIFKSIDQLNNFLIVSNSNKRNIVKIKSQLEQESKSLFKFKILTTKELINFLSFSIREEIYLANLNKGINKALTKEMIKFAKYNVKNIDVKLTSFLKDNKNYLIFHQDFLNSIKNSRFFILDNPIYLKPLLNFHNLNYEIIDFTKETNYQILRFNKVYDEVVYLFNEIAKLLNNNVNINNIYVANKSSSYDITIKKVANYYSIPIKMNNETKLSDIPYVKNLFNNNLETIIAYLNDLPSLHKYLEDYRSIDEFVFDKNINKVINLLNRYPLNKYDSNTTLKLLKEDLNTMASFEQFLTNAVNFVETEQIIALPENSFVFVINASYESFPKLVKDNEMLTDENKKLIGYPTSEEVNIASNSYLSKIITSDNIQYISYANSDNYLEYGPSDLVISYFNKLNIEEKNYPKTKVNLEETKTLFAPNLFKSYFSNSKDIGELLTTFTGDFNMNNDEKVELINHLVKKDLKISPTTLTRYYQVPFIYYLEKVLGVNTFQTSVNILIGNFFHLLAEFVHDFKFDDKTIKSNKYDYDPEINKIIFNFVVSFSRKEFDYRKLFDEFLIIYIDEVIKSEDKEVVSKTKFFIKKNKEKIISALERLEFIESLEDAKEIYLEKKVEDDNAYGYIDLLKFFDNNTFSIIDYKISKREAFSYEKILNIVDDLLLEKEIVKLSNLSLIQVIVYGYLMEEMMPNYKLDNVSYYSYLEDTLNLNGLLTIPKDPTIYTSGKGGNARFMNDGQKEILFTKIKKLIQKTKDNILNANFSVKVLKDEGNKTKLENTWFAVYQALAFFNNNLEESEDDENEEYFD